MAISLRSPFRVAGGNFSIANPGDLFADFFRAAFTFAHRARCAAAIFMRAIVNDS
jgi:hypothetical protein